MRRGWATRGSSAFKDVIGAVDDGASFHAADACLTQATTRLAYSTCRAHDSAVDRPQTSYAWNDGTALAYQVVGTSGTDLLLVPGSVSHLEVLWDEPRVNRFLRRFAAFCR